MPFRKHARERRATGMFRIPVLVLLLSLAWQAPPARAQDKSVGGHVGFGFPLVTHAGGDVTTIADVFRMSLPVAITVSGPGRMYFDLEFVPTVVDRPRDITLTVVNPGFLWRLGHGFASWEAVWASMSGRLRLESLRWWSKASRSSTASSVPTSLESDFVFRFDRPPDGRSTNPFTFNMVFSAWRSRVDLT